MLSAPEVVNTDAVRVALIPLAIPRAEIRQVMGPGITELMSAVAAQGVGPAGAWLTHHHRMDPEVFAFDICVPVSAEVTPVGRVLPDELPAARVARAVYQGPYEGLGDAWGSLMAWIEAGAGPRRRRGPLGGL
jgi:effector-binding domain-containing protein